LGAFRRNRSESDGGVVVIDSRYTRGDLDCEMRVSTQGVCSRSERR
jgi:hypothetical protein